MTKFMPLLKEGYAFRIYDYQEFPFREIKKAFMPRVEIAEMADMLEVGYTSLSHFISKRQRSQIETITRYLELFDLQLVLLKDEEIYSRDLDIDHLVDDRYKQIIAEEIGLSHTYFSNKRESHRIDLYLLILDYFGLELAITQKGEIEND